MEHGRSDERTGLVDTREDLDARLVALRRELVAKRSELALIRTRAEQAALAREASTPAPDRTGDWKGRLDAGTAAGTMAELALRRSMLYAEASLAHLRLMTVQNQVDLLEWSIRQLEQATLPAG